MHQSPADNTLPIAPESAKCCEAMRCGLRSLKGPQVVNRIEGPQFLRISVYVLQEYLRSPKINKQLPQHHKQTLVDFLHAMYFSAAVPNVGYCHCQVPANPETEVPVHRVSEVCRLHSNLRTKGAI